MGVSGFTFDGLVLMKVQCAPHPFQTRTASAACTGGPPAPTTVANAASVFETWTTTVPGTARVLCRRDKASNGELAMLDRALNYLEPWLMTNTTLHVQRVANCVGQRNTRNFTLLCLYTCVMSLQVGGGRAGRHAGEPACVRVTDGCVCGQVRR